MTIAPDLGDNVPITVVVKSARGGNIGGKLNGVFFLEVKNSGSKPLPSAE